MIYHLEERDGALVFVVPDATCPYCDGSGEVLMCGELWPCPRRCKGGEIELVGAPAEEYVEEAIRDMGVTSPEGKALAVQLNKDFCRVEDDDMRRFAARPWVCSGPAHHRFDIPFKSCCVCGAPVGVAA